jgi:hypothetical protein
MPFIANPRRDAHATIAGFFYQVNVTLLRWLSLQPSAHLQLECGEDIDTVENGSAEGASAERRLLEQLKVREGRSLTLRSPEALEALSNFCEHRVSNPHVHLRFRYLTTAIASAEKGWKLPEGGIETWMSLNRGGYDDDRRIEALGQIRKFLKLGKRPDRLADGAWDALQLILAEENDEALSDLVFSFEWALGYGDANQSESDVLSALVSRGHSTSIDEAKPVFQHLFAFVFRLLSQPGPKLLTIDGLSNELQAPTIPPNQRGIIIAIREELDEIKQDVSAVKASLAHQGEDMNNLKQTVEMIGRSYGFENVFALSAATLSTDLPELVSPRAGRQALVGELLFQAQSDGAVFLLGEPGSGKTQVLRLIIESVPQRPIWLNIPRGSTESQANLLIDSLIRLLAPEARDTSLHDRYLAAMDSFKDAVVVIDDLPRVLPGGPLAAQLETLAFCLKTVHAMFFVSSYYPLPTSMAVTLGNTAHDIPRFCETDVTDLLVSSDAPEGLRTEKICRLLVTVSEGLPVLVMAAVRYLANRGWNFSATELESLLRGEFAAGHRHDTAAVLQMTIPDVEERELLIRMSLAIGSFSKDDIAKVARVPKAIALPGEKVQRATGLWLQDVGNGHFLRSPLITSELSVALDPRTRIGVHYVLALQILARKSLAPIDVITCVHHLTMAQDMNFACVVLVQAFASIIQMEDTPEDDLGLLRFSVASVLISNVDINLRLYLSALQIVVLFRQGRDISTSIESMDALLNEAGGPGWGSVLSAGTLAIYLVWQRPILANKYLLQALAGASTVRLPDGSALPTRDYPIEGLLWMSAYSAKSDEEADSWLATIARFTPAQLERLIKSEMTEDNVTILCDGYWRREHFKPEAERDWDYVARKLDHIDQTARAIEFALLEAAAIRTRIMLLAEWQHRLADAVALAEASLKRFEIDDCRFLIMEVTGRQLGYANRREEAVKWLSRALSCDAYQKSLWRRNVLVTQADLHSAQDPKKAVEFTAAAVKMAKDAALIETIFIETLVEHGIALWRADERALSFQVFADVVNRVFAIQADQEDWKGLFSRIFYVLSYYSDVAQHSNEKPKYTEPEQGLFLSSNDKAHSFYKIEQKSYICIRLAMFADGVCDLDSAAAWTWRAIDYAKQIPAAWTGARLPSYYAIPSALLANDFGRASQLASILTSIDSEDIAATVKIAASAGSPESIAQYQAMETALPIESRSSALRVIPILPMAIRLVYLHLHGATKAETAGHLKEIETVIPTEAQPEKFCAELERALVSDTDWQILQREGFDAIRGFQFARGLILCLGAMEKAPISQSLYLQTYLAQQFEGWFGTTPSIYREIVAPMFKAYWERALANSTIFRTGVSYTTRQFEAADGTPNGTRRLLGAMLFCLGVKLPDETIAWLERADA